MSRPVIYPLLLLSLSYIVSIGIVDKLSLCIGNAQGGLDEESDFLMDSLSLLTCVTALLVSQR